MTQMIVSTCFYLLFVYSILLIIVHCQEQEQDRSELSKERSRSEGPGSGPKRDGQIQATSVATRTVAKLRTENHELGTITTVGDPPLLILSLQAICHMPFADP